MSFKTEFINIINKEKELACCVELQRSSALPDKCFLLDDNTVICYPRTTGDSRYPYCVDGFTLWAYSSGYMSLNESTFYVILPADEGKEPYVNFYGGLKNGKGYTPVSITGVARNPQEHAYRFTAYTPQAVYYVTKTENVAFALRAFVSQDKKACFSVCALNTADTSQEVYLSSFFNCLLMHQAGESVETKWFKQCKTLVNGYLFESVEDLDRTTHLENFGSIICDINATVNYVERTTSRADYVGGKNNCLNCSTALYSGHFEKRKQVCKFTDTAAAGDIVSITLDKEEFAYVDYVLEAMFDRNLAEKCERVDIKNYAQTECERDAKCDKDKRADRNMLKMSFGKFDNEIFNGELLQKFTASVQRQVEFAALAKNSGVSLLGVRDVAQQIEAALMWNPTACRGKILELLNFIDPSGRAPRQYSIPAKGAPPQMDTRAFIDQGNWIVTTLYAYLAFTDDYSILDETCGYYKIVDRNRVESVDLRDSVFDHLTKIVDYILNNVDPATNCLRALYGDWNDALDGLGVSSDPDKEYGSGVSVMATLHLYRNLLEMTEIVSTVGDRNKQLARYNKALSNIKRGLQKYAVEEKDGKRKILHGWGDKRAYKVGSFCDVDNISRDGLAANAFWGISGAYLWDISIKADILNAYKRLDSKYGLKTFEPYFAKEVKGVGRIVNLPKGTAENGATYVHATLFGVWSLFEMGESKLAWEQLEKALPIKHKLISTTPFVMSNSYSYNEELGLDGESMSDWFTGSANVLIKVLARQVFGVQPCLNGVTICPAAYMPFDKASISILVKGKIIKLNYAKADVKRSITVNGKTANVTYNEAKQAYETYIPTDELTDITEIRVVG